MSAIKLRSFDPLFLGDKGKTKLAQFQNMCTTTVYTFLRKIEQISDILLFSKKSGWSDLNSNMIFYFMLFLYPLTIQIVVEST